MGVDKLLGISENWLEPNQGYTVDWEEVQNSMQKDRLSFDVTCMGERINLYLFVVLL